MPLQVVSNTYNPVQLPMSQQLPCLVRNKKTGDVLLARKCYIVSNASDRNVSMVVLQPTEYSDLFIGQQVSHKLEDFENNYLLHDSEVVLKNS